MSLVCFYAHLPYLEQLQFPPHVLRALLMDQQAGFDGSPAGNPHHYLEQIISLSVSGLRYFVHFHGDDLMGQLRCSERKNLARKS